MKRTIIKIDEQLCNGCGQCVQGCHEGALQLIDGKARLVSELFCDGLGACIGECPVNAIQTETREAEEYSEIAVMERIAQQGEQTIRAHLRHLKEHNENEYFQQGVNYLREHKIEIALSELVGNGAVNPHHHSGCPGSREMSFTSNNNSVNNSTENIELTSQLRQWPIQLHLVNPTASYYKDADVLLSADCCAYTYANFHNQFMKNRSIAIACPKLDTNKDIYIEKLTIMINDSNINTLTVAIMEVPCCLGLVQLAKQALQNASRKIPIKVIIVGIQGSIQKEEWL
jgi:NAD-dependent dihydropyrimidine dehydrogenase PreA subunit